MSRHKRKKTESGNATIELNIMPFIDVFSLLCTFLLFSAVFVSVGIHVVQVPFLSNAASSSKDASKRTLKIRLDASVSSLEMESSFTEAPIDKQSHKYSHSEEGIKQLHQALVSLRQNNPGADKVEFFIDGNVNYSQIITLLDAIKLRAPQDPPLPKNTEVGLSSEDLFPKVVMGSVIL